MLLPKLQVRRSHGMEERVMMTDKWERRRETLHWRGNIFCFIPEPAHASSGVFFEANIPLNSLEFPS